MDSKEFPSEIHILYGTKNLARELLTNIGKLTMHALEHAVLHYKCPILPIIWMI